jgi:hypothetical protein
MSLEAWENPADSGRLNELDREEAESNRIKAREDVYLEADVAGCTLNESETYPQTLTRIARFLLGCEYWGTPSVVLRLAWDALAAVDDEAGQAERMAYRGVPHEHTRPGCCQRCGLHPAEHADVVPHPAQYERGSR